MRTGSCSVQQGLTAEAASIVKQAVTLAKRRGHAQVTPLHVANTMLSITNGLLRRACLQSHSHPLQCKALELCFNVALNRLPASSSSSSSSTAILGTHHSLCPSISNALVAAFKRAQAHQRRGSIENQQQPLLTVKIELEQLVISILDDPSVSRVMREAGFSSTQVKSNVEQAVSLEICAQDDDNNKKRKEEASCDPIREEDVASVIDNLGKQRRKSTVIVGESVSSVEGVIRRVMDKVDKGECLSLRGVKFVSLCLSGFSHASRVEVENKVEELRILAQRSCYVLYLGDLKWVLENRGRRSANNNSQHGGGCYCPVDHLAMEIGKLLGGGLLWLMAIATFRDYMRCKYGHPSLEALWGLHSVTIPARTLRLTLLTQSGSENNSSSKEADQKQPAASNCLAEPSQFGSLQGNGCNSDSSSRSTLPTWLQHCKNDPKGAASNHQQNCVQVGDLCQKWNSLCTSLQQHQPYPSSSSTSGFSYEHLNNERGRKPNEPTLRIYIPESNKDTNEPFLISPSNPNSTCSSDATEAEYTSRFKELNSENVRTLCNALEEKVPWQKEIIPEIVSTVLQCRSGMLRRKGNKAKKQETWLFFQGVDIVAKEKIARELARVVFGCESRLISIALSSFADSSLTEECRNNNKRTREETSCSYINRFADAVSCNPHRVFLVEDIEEAGHSSHMGFKRAIERGRVIGSNGEQVGLGDAIIILTCDTFSSRSSRCCSPSSTKQKSREGSQEQEEEEEEEDKDEIGAANLEETNPCLSLDLNISIDDDHSLDDICLLQSVDRRIVFQFQEL